MIRSFFTLLIIAFLAGMAFGIKSCASDEAKDNFNKATSELVKSTTDAAKVKAAETASELADKAAKKTKELADSAAAAAKEKADSAVNTVKNKATEARKKGTSPAWNK